MKTDPMKTGTSGFILKALIWLILLAGIGAAVAWYAMQEAEYEVTTQVLARGPVEETVAAISSGAVMPDEKAMVAAGTMGVIEAVHVEEGQRVKKGDLLVELQHGELDAQVEVAKANLVVAQSRLEQAKVGVSLSQEVSQTRVGQASAQKEAAQADYARMKALLDQKAISPAEMEKIRLALRVAEEATNAATAGKKEDQLRVQDVASAEALIVQLEAAIKAAEAARDRAFVYAPIDGVVAKINLRKGEATAMGVPLMQLVNDAVKYIEAPFDEANAAQIKVGEPARIELDAYPDQEFAGEVTYVSPVIIPNMDLSRTFTVRVKINDNEDKYVVGMSAGVTIIVQRKDDVLKAPAEALVREEFCYVVQEGRAVKREVQLGIGNWEFKEVLGGLNAGETIVTSVAVKGLADGVKIKPVAELGLK